MKLTYFLGNDSFWEGISLVHSAEDQHNNNQSGSNTAGHLALHIRPSSDLPLLPHPPANLEQYNISND